MNGLLSQNALGSFALDGVSSSQLPPTLKFPTSDLADYRPIINKTNIKVNGNYLYCYDTATFYVYSMVNNARKYALIGSVSLAGIYDYIISPNNAKVYLLTGSASTSPYYLYELNVATLTLTQRDTGTNCNATMFSLIHVDNSYLYYSKVSTMYKVRISDFGLVASNSGLSVYPAFSMYYAGSGSGGPYGIYRFYCPQNNKVFCSGDGYQLIPNFQVWDLTALTSTSVYFSGTNGNWRNSGRETIVSDGTYYYAISINVGGSPYNYYLVKGNISTGSFITSYSYPYNLGNFSSSQEDNTYWFYGIYFIDMVNNELWVRVENYTETTYYNPKYGAFLILDLATLNVKSDVYIGGYSTSLEYCTQDGSQEESCMKNFQNNGKMYIMDMTQGRTRQITR
ncbi:hypothetical protein ACJDU8_15805 [Clostridium sp. WILCCON 0269]|uniref:DUF5050 domain-containing protein n=1 Tax=Candidatus Clostridium eludens TaxID=3381663 RepID=A0ABW8SMX1_9CLOT